MTNATDAEKIVLGDEYDDELMSAVLEVLRDLGAYQTEKAVGVGGSQEVRTLTARIGEKVITLEAETYIGLSISGDPALVREVASHVCSRLPRLKLCV